MKKSWIRYLDYFYITRPILFFPGWSTLIAGYLVAEEMNKQILNFSKGEWSFRLFPESLGYMMIILAAAMGGSFILNQIKDIDSDKINKKLFLLEENCVPLQHAVWESAILILFSIITAYFINISTFLIIILFTFITGYLYNYQPFAFKNKPISGFLVNILMGWIAFALGWVISHKISIDFFLSSLPYLFLNTGLYLLTTIPDVTGDGMAAKKTFAVKYGHKFTVRVSLFCCLFAVISSCIMRDYFMIIFFILSTYWILNLALQQSNEQVIKCTKMSLFIFSILVSTFYYIYFLMIAFIYFLSRYYYRRRFGFDYPNFRGK